MKRYLQAFAMCQCMFCAIPFPGRIWNEQAREAMLLFLPLVGLEIGALWALAAWLCGALALPPLVAGAILCALPFLLTGYMHLDGFMDVTDAVRSYRDLDRRREILKDSRVGSFAVVSVVLLIVAQFAFLATGLDCPLVLLLIPVASRCCSAVAITILKPLSTSQYAERKANTGRVAALCAMLLCTLVAGFLLCGMQALALAGCLAGYACALRRGYKSLEGMNGDIAGYALTVGEMCALAVAALL